MSDTDRVTGTGEVSRMSNEANEEQSFGRWLIETALLVVLALILAQGIKMFLVQPFVIPSGSMIPTIHEKDRVLAEKISYRFLRDPQRLDVVVFNNPTHDPTAPILIKRLIATGGQTVDLRQGVVYVNGTALDEPYTHGLPSDPLNASIKYPFKVPEGYYWMMGDNRTNSGDSRQFGPVAKGAVLGHAVWTYWPVKSFSALK
jgi:signal peptidase I